MEYYAFIVSAILLIILLRYFIAKKPLTLEAKVNLLINQSKLIIMKLSEVEGFVLEVKAQIEKAKVEIKEKIQSLEDSLSDVTLPDGAISALAGLKDLAQRLDDIVPDDGPEDDDNA